MHKVAVAVSLMVAIATSASAQQWHKSAKQRHNRSGQIAAAYTDSLQILKLRIDSIFRNRTDSAGLKSGDAQYARLFLPLTFYNDVATNRMSIDQPSQSSADKLIDRALYDAYMRRPDLVETDQRTIDKEIMKKSPEQQDIINFTPDIVEKVAPKPEEPDSKPIDIIYIKKPNFWKFSGDYYLQFLQNYVSGNWYNGGESNYSMVSSITLQENYNNKQKIKWDNKLEMKLGFQTSHSDSLHRFKTTENLIRYTGKLGLQASKKWYYTLQLIAATQFAKSYKSNDPELYADFMSPFTLNASLGMDYTMSWLKNTLTGTIHLAPAAYNMKYVNRVALATRYGIDEGKHIKHDIGSELTVDFTWKFSDNISWKSRLYAYTSYHRVEMDFENTLSFQLTRLLAATLFVYPRFDDSRERDDHHGYWEFKEYSAIGLSYSF